MTFTRRAAVLDSGRAVNEKDVLVGMLHHDPADGSSPEMFPSVDRLCWLSGLSESTVDCALKVLMAHGVLRWRFKGRTADTTPLSTRKRSTCHPVQRLIRPPVIGYALPRPHVCREQR